jgi:hypothetical protein
MCERKKVEKKRERERRRAPVFRKICKMQSLNGFFMFMKEKRKIE